MVAIRLATLNDAEAIARQTAAVQQLHHEALPDIFKPTGVLFPAEKLAALIADANSIVAVAEMKGKLVGHIYGVVVNREENEFNPAHSYMYVQQIAVSEDVHRHRAGTALMAFIEDQARARGLSAVQVDHWAFNVGARRFYEACGFSPMKIVMRRSLKNDRR